MLFRCVVTSIVSPCLLLKMMNFRAVFIAHNHACLLNIKSWPWYFQDTFIKCIWCNISLALEKWSLHLTWNFILTFTDLHADECWTMEVLLNMNFTVFESTSTMVQNYMYADLAATTVLFPCYSHIATPSQVPCHYVCDPIDYVTSVPVWPLCWE